MPVQVFLQRLISFSPSEVKEENRVALSNYHWEMQTLDGNPMNLTASNENVVLINFWATWCPPCIAEMPSLQALYDSYGDRMDFYFITSEEPAKVQKFIQKKGYTFPVQIQTTNAPEIIATKSLPTTYVLNKSGEIVIKKTGAADWDSDKLHGLLDELILEE